MRPEYLYTITAEHVRNPKSPGKQWRALYQCIGRLLPGDVGKRVYRVGDIVQVENNEQRDARLAKES